MNAHWQCRRASHLPDAARYLEHMVLELVLGHILAPVFSKLVEVTVEVLKHLQGDRDMKRPENESSEHCIAVQKKRAPQIAVPVCCRSNIAVYRLRLR